MPALGLACAATATLAFSFYRVSASCPAALPPFDLSHAHTQPQCHPLCGPPCRLYHAQHLQLLLKHQPSLCAAPPAPPQQLLLLHCADADPDVRREHHVSPLAVAGLGAAAGAHDQQMQWAHRRCHPRSPRPASRHHQTHPQSLALALHCMVKQVYEQQHSRSYTLEYSDTLKRQHYSRHYILNSVIQ